MVYIRSGSDRGRTGKVLRVIPDKAQVIVQGINVHKKHLKPSQKNPQGGIIEKEMPLHISNVSPVSDGKPTRVRFQTRPDGSKVRVAAKTGQVIGQELKKASK
jgi:large subunit ribosomal protein L24